MIKGVRYRETFPTHDEAAKWEEGVRHAVKYGKPLPEARTVKRAKVQTMRELADYTLKHHYVHFPASTENARAYFNHICAFTGTTSRSPK
ncbi:hypothetical protein [Amorphus sp. MBR-141]